MKMSDARLSNAPDAALIPVRTGDIITFGTYPYRGEKDQTPIEWLVLDVTEDFFGERRVPAALLISRYGLIARTYHTCGFNEATIWEYSHLRKWLNRAFIRKAFTSRERQLILPTLLKNEGNPEPEPWIQDGLPPERDTWDRVFCLSLAEAERYFASDSQRACRPTPYAVGHGYGAFTDYAGNCFWWLRNPGDLPWFAACVQTNGSLYLLGYRLWLKDAAVRPALRIMLLPESGYCKWQDSPPPQTPGKRAWNRRSARFRRGSRFF